MEARNFLDTFLVTDIENDPLPIKVLRNTITSKDIVGQAAHWGFEYLDSRCCPLPLVCRLLQKLNEDIPQTDFSNCLEEDSNESGGQDVGARYEPLKLMQKIVRKLDEICVREREDVHDSVDGIIESPDMLPHVHGVSYNNIKNTRRFMEDRMTVLPRMDRIFGLPSPISYFAVFDGHNGAEAAAYGAAQLHLYLTESMKADKDMLESLGDAFENLDAAFVKKCQSGKVKSGSTAVVSLLLPGKLYVAWVGDSQVVLAKQKDVSNLVLPHKPDRMDEAERIRHLGGEIFNLSGTCRVNGNLAVSRAIGDAEDKKFIIATPDIKMIELDGTEEFLILACDGLWDEVSPEGAAQIVRRQIVTDPTNPRLVSQKLIHEAKENGSGDNISVIVVFLEPLESLKNRYEGVLEEFVGPGVINFAMAKQPLETVGISQLVDDLIEQSVDDAAPHVTEMNGHGKDGEPLVDFLSFGSSKESGGQLISDEVDAWDKADRSGEEDNDDKEVEELSDAEPDDEWQFEKPSETAQSGTVSNNGPGSGMEKAEELFDPPTSPGPVNFNQEGRSPNPDAQIETTVQENLARLNVASSVNMETSDEGITVASSERPADIEAYNPFSSESHEVEHTAPATEVVNLEKYQEGVTALQTNADLLEHAFQENEKVHYDSVGLHGESEMKQEGLLVNELVEQDMGLMPQQSAFEDIMGTELINQPITLENGFTPEASDNLLVDSSIPVADNFNPFASEVLAADDEIRLNQTADLNQGQDLAEIREEDKVASPFDEPAPYEKSDVPSNPFGHDTPTSNEQMFNVREAASPEFNIMNIPDQPEGSQSQPFVENFEDNMLADSDNLVLVETNPIPEDYMDDTFSTEERKETTDLYFGQQLDINSGDSPFGNPFANEQQVAGFPGTEQAAEGLAAQSVDITNLGAEVNPFGSVIKNTFETQPVEPANEVLSSLRSIEEPMVDEAMEQDSLMPNPSVDYDRESPAKFETAAPVVVSVEEATVEKEHKDSVQVILAPVDFETSVSPDISGHVILKSKEDHEANEVCGLDSEPLAVTGLGGNTAEWDILSGRKQLDELPAQESSVEILHMSKAEQLPSPMAFEEDPRSASKPDIAQDETTQLIGVDSPFDDNCNVVQSSNTLEPPLSGDERIEQVGISEVNSGMPELTPILNGKQSPVEEADIGKEVMAKETGVVTDEMKQQPAEEPILAQEVQQVVDKPVEPAGAIGDVLEKAVEQPKIESLKPKAGDGKPSATSKGAKSPAKPEVPGTKSRTSVGSVGSGVKKSPSKPITDAPKAGLVSGKPSGPANKQLGAKPGTTTLKPAVSKAVATSASAAPAKAPLNRPAAPLASARSATTKAAVEVKPISKSPTAAASRPRPASAIGQPAKPAPGLAPKPNASPKRVPPAAGTVASRPAATSRPAAAGVTKANEADAKSSSGISSTLAKPRPKPTTGTLSARVPAKPDNKSAGAEAKKLPSTGPTPRATAGSAASKPAPKPMPARSLPTSARTAPPKPAQTTSNALKPASTRPASKPEDKAPGATRSLTARPPPISKAAPAPKKIESTLKPKKPSPTSMKPGVVPLKSKAKPEAEKLDLIEQSQNGLSAKKEEEVNGMNITNGINGDHHGETEKQDAVKENGVHVPADAPTEVDNLI